MNILIIEDNDILRGNIKKYLEIKDHQVEEHKTYEWAVSKIMLWDHDIIILDLGLWDEQGDGLDICRQVREKGNKVPILMLTARTLTEQKVVWFEAGADDYLTKPFDYKELLVRLDAIVRRDHAMKGNVMHLDDITIYVDELKVEQKWAQVELSKLEFNLLLYLAQHKDQVLSKQQLNEKVWWETDLFKESRTLDIHVWYLRKKLGKDIIQTIRGIWYKIK